MEVRILRCHSLKEFTIKNSFFVAGSKDQPELASLRPLPVGKQPLDETANGRNPSASADKNGVLQRVPQGEHPVGTVKMDGLPLFYVAQQVGKETIIHAVQAQVEAGRIVWRRGDGVSAGNLPAFFGRYQRKKLSRNKVEAVHLLNGKLQVPGLLRSLDGPP